MKAQQFDHSKVNLIMYLQTIGLSDDQVTSIMEMAKKMATNLLIDVKNNTSDQIDAISKSL